MWCATRTANPVPRARARLLWDITPDLALNVIADYDKQRNSEQLYLQFARYELPYTDGPDPIPGCDGVYASPDNRKACGSKPSRYDGESWGFSAQLDYALGEHVLTSISAFRRYLQDGGLDVDGTPLDLYDNGNVFDNKIYTQELRIASPTGGALEYVTGLYGAKTEVYNYLSQNFGADIPFPFPGVFPIGNPNEYDAEMRSLAVFGQVTWRIDEQLRLIGGLRATRDEVEMRSQSFLTQFGVTTPLNAPLSGDDDVNNLSWKIGGQFDIDRSKMVYVTASRGYKGPQVVFNPPNALAAGTGQPITPASISIVSPEYPMDYEAGIKTSWFGGAMIANLNLFHTRIKDYQSSVFNAQGASTPNNIDRVVTKGVELDLLGMLYPGLTVSGGAVYNKATYPSYYVTCTAPNPGPQCQMQNGNLVENVAGQQLVGAPKWKLTLATNYDRALPLLGLHGFVGGDVVYRSAIRFNAGTDPRNATGEHAIVGARLGVRQPEQGWSLALFARNLFDERYPQFLYAPYLFSQYSAPGGEASGHALSTESFRMLGLTLDYEF